MAIFIIDFDQTLIDGQAHDIIAKLKPNGTPDEQWELVKNLPPVGGSAQKWKELFKKIWADGHHISFASRNAYGKHIIPRYLKEIIGLSDEELARINILSRYEKNLKDKNVYINEIITKYKENNIFVHYSRVVLVDDNGDYCIAAQENRYSAIHASNDGAHLAYMEDFSTITNKTYIPANYSRESMGRDGYTHALNSFRTTAIHYGPCFDAQRKEQAEEERKQQLADDNGNKRKSSFLGFMIESDDEDDQLSSHANNFWNEANSAKPQSTQIEEATSQIANHSLTNFKKD